ncbi:hypothetical protein BDL97_02G041900 [Sphagnum fallax]|nr:hypothetical protein BDL97_02G041900 [Sphagnum fallax]
MSASRKEEHHEEQHHEQQRIRSPSDDGDSGSEDDDEETSALHPNRRAMYPIPHSHWFPRSLSFKPWNGVVVVKEVKKKQPGVGGGRLGLPKTLRIQVSRPLPVRVTKDIVETYQLCNPSFQHSEKLNPKRYLTNPSVPEFNNGCDNGNHDLILYYGCVLVNENGTRRYVVKELVGQGTFGQVARCHTSETNTNVAVKIIKNQLAYYTQAKVEIGILHVLNQNHDPKDEHHVVRSYDHFSFQGHLCIVFELLGNNLFELLQRNQLKGISLNLVRIFLKQLLKALTLLHDAHVIHCDLKPENILLTSNQSANIKLIDFGSACMEHNTVYTYIQSRFYRSPEVLLGHTYTTAIDMWSLGCVAAELFLGLPLFPAQCAYDLLLFIKEKLRSQPPDYILRNAKCTKKYYRLTSAAPYSSQDCTNGQPSAFELLTPDENKAREGKKPVVGKRYFAGTLEEMIMDYHLKQMSLVEKRKELDTRKVFADFLRGLVECDPNKRWTPTQAAQHPFLTGEPFDGPFKPLPERPHTPVGDRLVMEHRVGSGHWFGAGLSPQVGNLTLYGPFNSSPQLHATPYSLASSHGSSFGSYGENCALGSSFGSYGDGTGMSVSYPATLNGQMSLLGGSPDARRLSAPHMQGLGQGLGHTQLGMSPSGGGRPLSLGGSPSHQFSAPGPPHFQTSPGSQYAASPGSQYQTSSGNLYQTSPGSAFQSSGGSGLWSPSSPSQGSPNRHGPTSPAHAVREAAAVGQYNKRRGAFPLLAPLGGASSSPHESVHAARLQQSNASGIMELGSGNSFSHAQGGVRMVPQWQPTRNSGNAGTIHHQSWGSFLASSNSSVDGGDSETLAAGPVDWDADFRDEHLLEDNSLLDSGFGSSITGMGPPDGVMGSGGARLGPGPGSRTHFSGPGSGLGPGSLMGNNPQPLLQGGVTTSHNVARTAQCQNGAELQSSSQGFKSGYGRSNVVAKFGPFSPNQNSPSRLGQQQQPLQAAHLQYWHEQHPPIHPLNQPQTHIQTVHHLNSFQVSSNFGTSSGPVGQRQAPLEVFNPLACSNLSFHQQQQFSQQSPEHQPLPNSPVSLPQRSHAPIEVESMCNSPGSSLAHQSILHPRHRIYSSNLFNGQKPGLPLVGVVRPPVAPVAPVQRDYQFAK